MTVPGTFGTLEARPGGELLATPKMTGGDPGPGKRVRRVAPEYAGTDVHHSLYLPTDWKPGGKFPVIVEYTGNRAPFCGSTGKVEDAGLGFGLSGGERFIWVVMPYIETGRKKNAPNWWGDRQATIDYCKTTVPRICAAFGGDPDNVFICGFSRGAIAANYIGLADDEIARLWRGFVTHDHYDGERKWGYAGSDRASALERLRRLEGRPVLVCNERGRLSKQVKSYLAQLDEFASFTFVDVPVREIFEIPTGRIIHSHTDLWMSKDSPQRRSAREWLADAFGSRRVGAQ